MLAFFKHNLSSTADVTVFQIGEARKRPGEAEKFPSSERFIYALETSTNEHPICCTQFLYLLLGRRYAPDAAHSVLGRRGNAGAFCRQCRSCCHRRRTTVMKM